jgi:glycosyltransferase involved in cell wall biosynthesis
MSRQTLRGAHQPRKLRAVTLNVLHVDTERGWRGGERQTLWLARELAARGHGSVVAARTGEPLASRAHEQGLDVVPCSPASELDPRAAWALRRAIVERGINVVHAHTAHAVATAAIATLRLDVPLVVARRVDFKLRDNVGTRWKYGRASVIVAISHAVARVLEASGVSPNRIRVVPDGVDVHRRVTPATADTLASLGVRAGAPLVVQVAQLVGHKDPVNFVRAVACARERVPDVQALLVGDGPLRGDVEAEMRALHLEGTLHVAGYRTDADELLAAADVACLSSREEGMGSVLLDALAFGRPIVATRAGGIPEVVDDGKTGLLASVSDPRALGDAIVTLFSDAQQRARFSEQGKLRAMDFSVERMTDRTVEVYQEVLGPTGGGRRSRTDPPNSSNSSFVTRAP